ncbi:group I truncated hemoglobin [Herbaspirillum seropedicae]|uniref:group I truncated hemoglobin n=1 Tax=Herbaspirillum seropedicae TaxID=964 RepID=UPI003F8CFFFC
MIPRTLPQALAVAALAVSLWAPPAHAADTLFADLGGLPVVRQTVHDFMANMLADARIRHTFDHSNLKRVEDMLVEQFCMLSGGPCTYTGDPMKEVHQGLKLTNADFNALVEDLQQAMDKNGIPFRTQNRLLALLAPMQRDTVTR